MAPSDDSLQGFPTRRKASRWLRLAASALLPFAVFVALLGADMVASWQSQQRLAASLTNSRRQIEELTSLRRQMRQTHILLLERMLAPADRQEEREREILASAADTVSRAKRFTRELEGPSEDREAALRLFEITERWESEVRLNLHAAASALSESRARLDAMDLEAAKIFESSSAAGASADMRLERGFQRHLRLHLLVMLAVGVLLLLVLVVWRRAAEARARLTASERRREDLHRMASSLAHEVNNQLGVLENTAALLSKRHPNEEAIGFQREAAEQIRALTGNLLALSTAGSGAPEPTDVAELLTHVARPLGDGVQVHSTGAANVVTDRAGLARAALNLMKNALEAGAPVEVSIAPRDGGVLVTVCDSGPGIPASQAARIGEPFFTTKARGTGLGLPIVREFADRSGGRFSLRNRTQGGAIAELWLPAGSRPAAQATAAR